MTQTLIALITAFIALITPLFNLSVTQPVLYDGLMKEDIPASMDGCIYDKIDGIADSEFYIAKPDAEKYNSVNAEKFGVTASAEDNYDAFCRAIQFCKENSGTRLVINSGKYYFRNEKDINLNGLKNTLIDADGAIFIFENPNYFILKDCECVEFRGLSITWNFEKSFLGSLVKVKNVNKNAHSLEIEFIGQTNVNPDIPIMAFTEYDADTLTPGVRHNFKENYIYNTPEIIKSVEKKTDNTLEIIHDGSLDGYANGEMYLLRHHVYGGNAFNVYRSSNITFDGINLYAVAGMGWLIEDRCERFQLIDCKIALDPEFEKINRISATADGVHIANTNGKFRISGCDFSFMGDDCVNVHDNIAMITKLNGSQSIEFYTNADNFRVGDTVEFNTAGYEKLDFSARVVEKNGNVMRFDRNLPDSITVNSIICNSSIDSGNYVISNNYFHENRARGLLLQSDNGLCENNKFYKIMANAIKIITDISEGNWLEGTGVNGLEIKNNTFIGCNVVEWSAQIEIATYINGESANCTMFCNINIENNRFEDFYGKLINASNVSILRICGNTVSNRSGSWQADRGRIVINKGCHGVTIKENSFEKSFKAPFQKFVRLRDIKALY